MYDACAWALHRNLGPARSGTPEYRDHPFPAKTSQSRDLTLKSLPSHTGALTQVGLGIGLLTQEGGQQQGAAREGRRGQQWQQLKTLGMSLWLTVSPVCFPLVETLV